MSNDMRDLVARASAWLAKMESPSCTPLERRSFQQWIDADVTHRAAVAIASRARRQRDEVRQFPQADGRGDLLLSPQYTPRPLEASAPAAGRQSRSHAGLFALVAAGAACMCAAGWYASRQLTWEDYSTHVGGKQTSPLPDGSSLTLNTDSDLRVRVTPGSRELVLTRGECVIRAAPDRKPPLRVVAGNAIIRTAGADFDVRRYDSGEIEVLVMKGRVSAEIAGRWLNSPRAEGIIHVGYMAVVGRQNIELTRLDTGELARRTAWLRNVLDFKGETLAQAVEAFNRYNTRKIVIDDPAIATRRVGGVFVDTEPDSFVAALAPVMHIRAIIVDGQAGPGYGTIRLRGMQARR
jgi:transmembrane sensor